MNVAASGASALSESRAAAVEAVSRAVAGLDGKPAKLGFVFASSTHALRVVLDAARATAPGVDFIGTHSAGELTDAGFTRHGVSVLLVASDRLETQVKAASGVKQEAKKAARAMCSDFAAALKSATTRGLGLSTTVLFVDGLAGSGEKLVREVLSNTRMYQQVVGVSAADDGAFEATWVGANGEAGADSAAVVHVFDTSPWGVGVDHGFTPQSPRMTVTKAKGHLVAELDGVPAFEKYAAWAKERGHEGPIDDAFLVRHPLGLYFLDQLHHARVPVAVGPNGELQLAGDVNEGAGACFLEAQPEALVAACKRAAAEAKANLKGAKPAGVLVFDSLCRGMLLGAEFGRELQAIAEVFPGVPMAGVLGTGEISRFKGRLDGWHNAAVVVAAIPA